MTGTCSTEQLEYPDQVVSWAALRLGAPGAQRVECSSGAGVGVGAGVGAVVAPAEPVEWVRWKMARLGLAWLDLRLAALPDTLFKFLLVSNQPQPASQPAKPAGATPMHSTWDATHPQSSHLLQARGCADRQRIASNSSRSRRCKVFANGIMSARD